ncbi:MAG: hypothetical protein IIB59_06795 [Planctomycetes bacterium]|nr:hypothetical protein [Planctomycetota bacterium]
MGLPISYHWRNLLVRKTTTLLTLLVVAVVVGVFTWMMGFASSLTRSLAVASDETKLLILKRGATAESNSAIPIEDFNRLNQLSAIVRDEDNNPLLSPEMMAQVSLPRERDGGATFANVAVRGVTAAAFKVHRNVKLLGKGRCAFQHRLVRAANALRSIEHRQVFSAIADCENTFGGFRRLWIGYVIGRPFQSTS